MNPILLDFRKVFATIKNDKNNIYHLKAISKMIDVFESKYVIDYNISTHLLVIFLREEFKKLNNKILK